MRPEYARTAHNGLITGTQRYDNANKIVIHITPILAELHWLPIKSRVSFNLATLVYNIHQSGSPSYLASLLADYKPVTPIFVESVNGGYSTQAQDFTKTIPSLGRRGLELYSVDCVGNADPFKLSKTIKTHLLYIVYKTT